MRPGRTTPLNKVRPWPSLKVVVLMVFCFFFPEMKTLRPGRPALGRRTWTSVPSIRSSTLSMSEEGVPAGQEVLVHLPRAKVLPYADGHLVLRS
jgi:hypothetical protein